MGWSSRKVLISASATVSLFGKEKDIDCIAFSNEHGLYNEPEFSAEPKEKYSVTLPKHHVMSKFIQKHNVFVVNFFEHGLNLHKIEKLHPHFQDQWNLFKLHKTSAKTLECMRIAEADAFIECEVIEHIPKRDTTTFVGKITYKE